MEPPSLDELQLNPHGQFNIANLNVRGGGYPLQHSNYNKGGFPANTKSSFNSSHLPMISNFPLYTSVATSGNQQRAREEWLGQSSNSFPFRQNGSGNFGLERDETMMEKRLIHSSLSGLSEMSESSVELLKSIIQNPNESLNVSSDLGPLVDAAKKRKFDAYQMPIPEDKKQRLNIHPGNFAATLEKNVLQLSMDEVIESMRLLTNGAPLNPGSSLWSLEEIVKDKNTRMDRFHRKKSSSEIFKKPLKSLTKKEKHDELLRTRLHNCRSV
mmetsp:Transcript_12860/g.20406  ORF Transcript_12860/g.20406 Transcript_12860/m.20406 type:complete len:270 (-) Transcript_12860:750-1559(-)